MPISPNLQYQIALSLIKGIGPKLARNLIAYLGSELAVFEPKKRSYDKIPGIGSGISLTLNSIDRADLLKQAENELRFIERNNITPLFFTCEKYPRRLSFCDDAPLLLYVKGDVDLDAVKIISIVGTREPTDYGITLCDKLVNDIASRHPGTVIVSGLAYGIDIRAHRAAMNNNLPTIAVLAHGLDKVYPAPHTRAARDIAERGALVTEFRINTNADKQNFLKRNRIIAGISDAVIVVESASRGGALVTADIASGYSRDVMAFPGRVGDEKSTGCNKMIKTNVAAMIESVEDVEYLLGWETLTKPGTVQGSLFAIPESPEEKTIIDILLVEKEMNLNLLALKCAIPVGKVSAILLDLEFKGLIKSRPGGIFKLL